jgi:DNA polymerase III epsilon subunit-like protein
MRPQLYCIADVETTGTRPVEKYGVVQIAGVICMPDAGTLREIDCFDFRCAPHVGDLVSKEALGVNGLTIEQLRTYPPPAEVHAKLIAQLGKHVRKFDKSDKDVSRRVQRRIRHGPPARLVQESRR